jgi:hypothetical protein
MVTKNMMKTTQIFAINNPSVPDFAKYTMIKKVPNHTHSGVLKAANSHPAKLYPVVKINQ